jgi:hypothetical protein
MKLNSRICLFYLPKILFVRMRIEAVEEKYLLEYNKCILTVYR